jgi:hypothetical protein
MSEGVSLDNASERFHHALRLPLEKAVASRAPAISISRKPGWRQRPGLKILPVCL